MTFALYAYARLSRKRQVLVADALGNLVSSMFRVKFVPFPKVVACLGEKGVESPYDIAANQQLTAEEIGWAIRVVCRQLHGYPTCLMQAVAAKSMLRKRGRPLLILQPSPEYSMDGFV